RYALEYTFKGGVSYDISIHDSKYSMGKYHQEYPAKICHEGTSYYLCNDTSKKQMEFDEVTYLGYCWGG
ncbi:MAG: hypothetical protein Q4D80_04970, partial [Pseudomonadota bacterium]|nr:hypothetical protein [Pseudomonadota bacterium]